MNSGLLQVMVDLLTNIELAISIALAGKPASQQGSRQYPCHLRPWAATVLLISLKERARGPGVPNLNSGIEKLTHCDTAVLSQAGNDTGIAHDDDNTLDCGVDSMLRRTMRRAVHPAHLF